MKSRKIFSSILSIGFLFIGTTVSAQDTGILEAEPNEALAFSTIARNPSKAAKGFVGVASSNNMAWSSFDNAAVIPFSEKTLDVGVLYQNWAPDGVKFSNFGLGAAGHFLDKFGLSFGFLMQQGAPYDLVNESGTFVGEAKENDLQINLGLAYKIGDIVSVGLNAKYLKQNLMDDLSYCGFATDIIAQCKLSDFSFAAGMSNLGTSVKDESGNTFTLPTSVTLGADYGLNLAGVHDLELDADLNYFLSGNLTAGFGMEYGFNEMVYARAGYHYGSKKAVLPSFATVGLGVQFFGVKLDFAYIFAHKELRNTMTIGLGYSF